MQDINQDRHNSHAKTIFVFGILVLLRLALSNRLPAYILADMPHDDAWVVNRAMYILNQQWLGPYDQYTLIKGVFSPLLMAFSAYSGIAFGVLNTALYCAACLVFVVSIRSIIKNNWVQILCLGVLLFNPITYALETGQRVYRNGIGQWQVLLIFGCFIAIFLRRNENWAKLLPWSILGGLSLGVFLNTREDGAWIYPFVVGSIFVTIWIYFIEKQKTKVKIFLFALPAILAALVCSGVTIINYSYYGTFIVNDRNGGNYAKVAADLYSITPNVDEDILYKSDKYKRYYYNIYISTMEKAFDNSPTLKSAEPSIREAIKQWASWDDPNNIGQLSTDHMLFALRDGIKFAGYYRSLPDTEAFYGKVHNELQIAFKNGSLVKRGFTISPLIMPLQHGDIGHAFSLMSEAIRNILEFKDVSSVSIPARGSEFGIKQFGFIAGGDYFLTQGGLIGNGWAFSKDDGNPLTAGLYDVSGALIANLSFDDGDDVFKYMDSIGFKYINAKKSRFSFNITGHDEKSGVTLRFMDKGGNLFREIPLDGSAMMGEDSAFRYYIDNLKVAPVNKFYDRFVRRANTVSGIYKSSSLNVFIFSCLIYLIVTISLFYNFFKKKESKTLHAWLVLSGLLSTFLLFVFSMCLITATSFPALLYVYTAPAYAVLLMFYAVSICCGVETVIKFRRHNYL